jgi:hypothetical protein
MLRNMTTKLKFVFSIAVLGLLANTLLAQKPAAKPDDNALLFRSLEKAWRNRHTSLAHSTFFVPRT